MKRTNWILLGFVFLLALGLMMSYGCARKEGKEQEATKPDVELPAAAKTIQDATEDFTSKRLEKSEIWSEIKKEGETGTVVKLDTFQYVYEAELEKDGQTGEIAVDAEGNITEPLKWDKKE